MNIKRLKGIAIVSLAEGTKLGRVDAPLFDPATLQLRAIRVKGDGQSFIIPWARVQTVGADAVMVASSAVTQATTREGEFGGLAEFDALKRLQIVDAAGTLIGTLRDLELDSTTGRALSLGIHKGGLLGLGGETTTIDAAAIRSIGSDLITVAEVAVSTPAADAATPAIATPQA
jgi:sporulation protein YlmC with PRC-barrel domain